MTQSHDLQSLTQSALKDIETRAQHQRTLQQQSARQKRPWLRWVGAVALGIVAFAAIDSRTYLYWMGVSDHQQLTELTAALTAANAAVDRSHATTGEWPDRVPLPALAALVELQNPGPNYRLLARTEHWQLTMTPSGNLEKKAP